MIFIWSWLASKRGESHPLSLLSLVSLLLIPFFEIVVVSCAIAICAPRRRRLRLHCASAMPAFSFRGRYLNDVWKIIGSPAPCHQQIYLTLATIVFFFVPIPPTQCGHCISMPPFLSLPVDHLLLVGKSAPLLSQTDRGRPSAVLGRHYYTRRHGGGGGHAICLFRWTRDGNKGQMCSYLTRQNFHFDAT